MITICSPDYSKYSIHKCFAVCVKNASFFFFLSKVLYVTLCDLRIGLKNVMSEEFL